MKKKGVAMLLSMALAVNMCSLTAAATEIEGLTIISEDSGESNNGGAGNAENAGKESGSNTSGEGTDLTETQSGGIPQVQAEDRQDEDMTTDIRTGAGVCCYPSAVAH